MNKFEFLAGLMALPISANARLTIFWLFESFNPKDDPFLSWMGNDALADKLNCSRRTAERAIAEVLVLGIFKVAMLTNEELWIATRHRPKGQQARGNPTNQNRLLTFVPEQATTVIRDGGPACQKAELSSRMTGILSSDVTGVLSSPVTTEPQNSEPRNVEPRHEPTLFDKSVGSSKQAESEKLRRELEEFVARLA